MTSPLVAIVGPTASGKTRLAIKVAKKFNGEVICADSRTIYKGMDIGTAKPTKQEQSEVRHHLLDIAEPDQRFTVADFKRLALRAVEDIAGRGKLPIMVGGSGLYIDAVLFDFNFGKPANLELRETLASKSVSELQRLCRQKNIGLPKNYLNKRHLIRAIETGGLTQQELTLRSNTLVVGVTTKKETLHRLIEQRAMQMVKNGIVSEVISLAAKYGWEAEAMKGNIYRVFKPVADGDATVEEGTRAVVQSDIKLVKKQLTWFKRNPHVIWGSQVELMGVIEQFVARNKKPAYT